MTIKRTWMVCGLDGFPLGDKSGNSIEFNSEKAALAAAGKHVNESGDDEAWVFALTHVVERPSGKPTITKV